MELESQTIRVADLDLHWLEIGEGQPVLFVHGWPARAELWRNILPVVGRSHRAIALDLPGFGRSGKPLGRRYGFGFFSRAIDGLLDHLGVERTGLVVHDLGGPAGLYWACRNPGRIRALGLLNTVVFPELSWMVKAFVAATHLPGLRGYLASPAGIARAMRFGVADPAKITPEIAEMYGEPWNGEDALGLCSDLLAQAPGQRIPG